MSTIRSTVESALPAHVRSSYASYINDVVGALEAREEQALAVIREQGVEAGASESQVEGILETAGLVEPTPEPVAEAVDEAVSVEQQIAALTAQVSTLTTTLNDALAAARRQGVRI